MHSRLIRAALSLCLLAGSSVPLPVRAQPPSETRSSTITVELNSASAEALTSLPGIGKKRARAILEQRRKRPFRRVEELGLIRGIGKKTIAKLRARLRVAPPPPATPPPAQSSSPPARSAG